MIDGKKIFELRERLGLSQADLARAAGVSQPVINDIESGKQRTTKRIAALASALRVDVSEIDPDFRERPHYEKPASGESGGPYKGDRERTLPVYAAAEGGLGELVVNTDPIEYVPRPWFLGEVRDGYAVLVVGESMIPAFRPGEIAIINPRLPPMRGRDHILVQENESGEFKATIKHVISWTDMEWKLEQYNPHQGQDRVFSLPRRIWGRALRVVGKYESR